MQISTIKNCIALMIFGVLTLPVTAVENNISRQDLHYMKQPFATVHVAVEHAPFYRMADETTQPIWTLAWVDSLDVDGQRMVSAPSGWIPVKALGHVKGRNEDVPEGWVRRSDVVLPSDFRKVVGCWPVKAVVYVGGDYAAEVKFKLNGSASVKESGDESWINKQPPHRAQVYMARGIVAIEALEKNRPRFFMSGYRNDERRLYPGGATAKEQEFFPDSTTKNCEAIPMLAK